jgi:hypothetical protein
MMNNFTQILRLLLMMMKAPSKINHFEGMFPFKVQFNFEILLFEGQIDAYALEKWLILQDF